MTTSYTPNLGLAKPATGDTGWGTTINDRTTAMVEEAIAGKATINTWGQGGDAANTHTLTENNGASSEARAAILHLTDTTSDIGAGDTGILIVPAKTKLYCIINETGHTVFIKTASGSGLYVLNANIINVVCDGTDVKEQNTYIVSAAVGNISVTDTVFCEQLRLPADGSGAIFTGSTSTVTSSPSLSKIISEKGAADYANEIGAIRNTEIIKPWSSSETITGDALPYKTCGENALVTVASFTVHGNSRTVAQELDLNINGQLKRTGFGPSTYAQKIGVWVVVKRASKSSTGTSIGTVAVADVPASGDASSYYKVVQVSGDVTHLIDSFTSIATDASGTNAKPVVNANYNASTNRTEIYYDSGLGATGIFGSTGVAAFISASRFQNPGTYVIANPENIAKLYSQTDMLTFDLSEYVAPVTNSGDNIVTVRKSIQLPKLKLAPNGTAGNVEITVQISAGRASLEGTYDFYSLQVDQTNITRPI